MVAPRGCGLRALPAWAAFAARASVAVVYGQMILLSENVIALFLLFICHIYFSFIIIALAMYYNTIV